MIRGLLFAIVLLVGVNAAGVHANGGNIRIAEGKYLVNISSSPVTPAAGEEVVMLISFADVATNALLGQDLRVWIEIRRKGSEKTIFPPQEFLAQGGILEFSFLYPQAGLHELFVRFEKPDEQGKVYAPEDFLIDVQKARTEKASRNASLVSFFLALMAGFGIGFAVKAALRTKKPHAQ